MRPVFFLASKVESVIPALCFLSCFYTVRVLVWLGVRQPGGADHPTSSRCLQVTGQGCSANPAVKRNIPGGWVCFSQGNSGQKRRTRGNSIIGTENLHFSRCLVFLLLQLDTYSLSA